MDLLPLVEEFITAHRLLSDNDRVLVSVSGGPDSMALLHLLHRWGRRRLAVFHLDHGFRAEAASEAEFVRRVADEWYLPCHVVTRDVAAYLRTTGESKQQGARQVRYQELQRILDHTGFSKAALGHTADDQSETILMRLLRGTGLTGLTGIPTMRGPFVRPLLAVWKQQILVYCEEYAVPFCCDHSNDSMDFTRNRIRLDLIPHLEKEYNPQVRAALWRLGDLTRADENELQRLGEAAYTECVLSDEASQRLDREKFRSLSLSMQRRVLRRCCELLKGTTRRLEHGHFEELIRLIERAEPFEARLPHIFVTGEANTVVLTQTIEPSSPGLHARVLHVPGELSTGCYRVKASCITCEEIMKGPSESLWIQDFDAADLSLPLLVRGRKPGDTLRSFGDNRQRSLRRLFIDAKVPRSNRDSIPLICDQEEVLWVPGVRRSEKGRISQHTKRIIRIYVESDQDCQKRPRVL